MTAPTSFVAEKIIFLLGLKLSGKISAEQLAELEAWAAADPANQQLIAEMEDGAYRQTVLAGWTTQKTDAALARVTAQLKPRAKVWGLQRWISVAAAVAVVVFGVWFYKFASTRTSQSSNDLVYTKDIAPGKQGATLTLASGKKIRLADAVNGELAKEAGVSITKTADGQVHYEVASAHTAQPRNDGAVNTLSTAKGETYQVQLPDGTKVWLNAASSLTYSAALKERGVRRVKLEGEAYFEVATAYMSLRGQQTKQPFIVESLGQQVEVLGTHFNIKAYKDENSTETTLLEGSVKVSSLPSGVSPQRGERILRPNQQATLAFSPSGRDGIAREGTLSVGVADPNATAWVIGKFRFNNTPLPEVMKQLARWYDVEVVYPEGVPEANFRGGFNRNLNASGALKILQIMKVKFKIEGKKIIVYP